MVGALSPGRGGEWGTPMEGPGFPEVEGLGLEGEVSI